MAKKPIRVAARRPRSKRLTPFVRELMRTEYLSLGMLDEALALFNVDDCHPTPDQFLACGKECLRQKRFVQALKAFTLGQAPPSLFKDLADAAVLEKGGLQLALKAYDATGMEPPAQIFADAGRYWLECGDTNRAVEAYRYAERFYQATLA
jgi:hypothetical protein